MFVFEIVTKNVFLFWKFSCDPEFSAFISHSIEKCNRYNIIMFKILLPILILNLSLFSAQKLDEWTLSNQTFPNSNKPKYIMVSQEVFDSYNRAHKFCNDMFSNLYQVPPNNHVSYLNGLADYLAEEEFSSDAVIDSRIIKSDFYNAERKRYDKEQIEICLVVGKTRWWHKFFSDFFSVTDIKECSKIDAHAVCERDRPVPEKAVRSIGAYIEVRDNKDKGSARYTTIDGQEHTSCDDGCIENHREKFSKLSKLIFYLKWNFKF